MSAQLFRVVVPVADLDSAARFYSGLFGVSGEHQPPAWYCFNLGGALLVCSTDRASPLRVPLFVATDDPLPQLQIRARQLGARQVDQQIRKLNSGEHGFTLIDPFGNALCLVDAGSLRWSNPIRESNDWGRAERPELVLPLEQDFLNAVKGGELNRVSELLAVDPELIDVVDRSGVSVLMVAAYKRQEKVASFLLPLRKSLNIWEAAAFGQVDRLRALLLQEPPLLRHPAPDGYLPLGLACFFGQIPAVDFLLQRGAPVNKASMNGVRAYPLNSALTQAPEEIALTVVQRLLKAGAIPNVSQALGHTPLHQAAGRGFAEVVELLLNAGASADERSDNGSTPADLARAAGHIAIARRLDRHVKKVMS